MASSADAATEALILQLIAEDAGFPLPVRPTTSTSSAPDSPTRDFEDLEELASGFRDCALDDNHVAYEEAEEAAEEEVEEEDEEESIPVDSPSRQDGEWGGHTPAETYDWGLTAYQGRPRNETNWDAEDEESSDRDKPENADHVQASGIRNWAENSWFTEVDDARSEGDSEATYHTNSSEAWNATEASIPGANWSYGRDGSGLESWEGEELLVGSPRVRRPREGC